MATRFVRITATDLDGTVLDLGELRIPAECTTLFVVPQRDPLTIPNGAALELAIGAGQKK